MLDILVDQVGALLQPRIGGWGVLDYYGALRLAQIVTGMSKERRMAQELFGLMVVVLGPETFLGEFTDDQC